MTHAIGNYRTQDVRKRSKPTDFGLEVLAQEETEVPVEGPVTVATTVVWAQSVRRFARVAVWALPVYGLLYGIVTAGHYDDTAPQWQRLTRLAGSGAAGWLGVVALVALAALLVAARSRRTALIGMLAGTAGTAVLLPVLGLASYAMSRPFSVTVVAWVGGGLYTLGWLLIGSAVVRSGVLNRTDGVLLMVASPMIGVGGVLFSPLRTVGGLLLLAAGIGLANTASRLVPAAPAPVRRARLPIVPISVAQPDVPVVPASTGEASVAPAVS
jgi:hypothetical protein